MPSIDDTDHRLLLPSLSPLLWTPLSPTPGFLLDRGRYTTIEICGALVETAPLGINDRGEMAGAYEDGKSDRGFMRDRRGRVPTIDVPGAQGTAAQKINNRSQITGVYSDTSPDTQDPGAPERGFLLDRGKLIRIDVPAVQIRADGLNDRGQVVGEYVGAGGTSHGFLWDGAGRPPSTSRDRLARSAVDINDRGQIVGVYQRRPCRPSHRQRCTAFF